MSVSPAKTQISLGIRPVWSVFAIRMKKHWVLSYPLSAQRRLWSDGRMPRLIWVFAGRTLILLVLSNFRWKQEECDYPCFWTIFVYGMVNAENKPIALYSTLTLWNILVSDEILQFICLTIYCINWFSIPLRVKGSAQANENGPMLDCEISRDFKNISNFIDCFGLFHK